MMDPFTQWLEDPDRITVVVVLVGIVVALIRGWIVPGWAYQERDEEAGVQRDARDEMVDLFRDQVVPALVRATDALRDATRVLDRHLDP